MDDLEQARMNAYLLEQLKRLAQTQEFLARQCKEAGQRITAAEDALSMTQHKLTELEGATTVLLGAILAEAAAADSELLDRLGTRMDAHIYTHGDDEKVCKAVHKAKELLHGAD